MTTPSRPRLILSSFGLKAGKGDAEHYVLPRAHVYLDCRALPDGVGIEKVQEWLTAGIRPRLDHYLHIITQHIESIPARRKGLPDPFAEPIRICCMCAWGHNRSVTMKQILAEAFVATGNYDVEVI